MSHDPVYPTFLRALERCPTLPAGARVCVAFSGGLDSTALLLLFLRWQQRRRPDLQLLAGHVHHGLRGAEADAAARHCQRFAEQRQLRFLEQRVDVESAVRASGGSVETVARRLRHEVFERWALDEGLQAVAVGHHADDQLETVLGNLVRGAGLQGIVGMSERRPLPGRSDAELWRPLLSVTREELVRFVADHEVTYCEDSSNRDLRYRRNQLRHQIVPALREVNPELRSAVLGLADEARAIRELRDLWIAPYLPRLRCGREVVAVRRSAFRSLPHEAALAALLDHVWQQASGQRTGLNRDHHRAWCSLLRGEGSGHRYCLPDGYRLERAADWIYLYRPDPGVTEMVTSYGAGPGEVTIPGLGLTLKLSVGPAGPQPGEVVLGPAGGSSQPLVRPARATDRISFGPGRARVTESLRARGVPRRLRSVYPVVELDGEVVWVPGVRARPAARPTSDTPASETAASGTAPELVWRGTCTVAPEESSEAFVLAQINESVR